LTYTTFPLCFSFFSLFLGFPRRAVNDVGDERTSVLGIAVPPIETFGLVRR
jgi:hypothetical protein